VLLSEGGMEYGPVYAHMNRAGHRTVLFHLLSLAGRGAMVNTATGLAGG
jgi:hypothetical protein